MAIINPSKSFENSDLNQNGGLFRYIKPDVKTLIVNLKENKEGVHLYFLPAYKVDANENGVWYKKFRVRRNFGVEKESYYIKDPLTDPVAHFERQFKKLYKEDSVVKEVAVGNKKFKEYPAYGNATDRVVFNVINISNEAKDGVQVFDLPAFNGADQLTKYHNTPDLKGNYKRLVCDPKGATLVFVKLSDSTNPWEIRPDPSQIDALPSEFSDTDYLINLDDIFIEKSNEELMAKLRAAFHPTQFDKCMDGFAGLVNRQTIAVNPLMKSFANVPDEPKEPEATVAPAVSKFKIPTPTKIMKAEKEEVADEGEVLVSNPVSAKTQSRAEVLKFLGKDK